MNRRLLTSLYLVLAGLTVTGCDPNLAQTVEETDAAVYTIIDDAWDDSYGSRDNYIIDSNDPNHESATLELWVLDIEFHVGAAEVGNLPDMAGTAHHFGGAV